MDINARINWKPGMELTDQTFLAMDDHLDFRQQMALRVALGNNRMGVLPDAPFNNAGMFVKNHFEMEHFQCLAVLPSGRIVDVDDSVSLPIPMLYGNQYYLAVGFGQGQKEFERDGIAYTRPQYEYGIYPLEDIEKNDLLPIIRFHVDNGLFTIDTDYIAPCLLMSADERFKTYIDKFVSRLESLTAHANLEDGEGKRALLRYMFRLRGYGLHNSVHDFVLLMQEVVQAIDYYIISPHIEQPAPIVQPSQCDVQKWLKWVDEYMAGGMSVLDTVVLEDNTIDYEALLAQAKKELYDQLSPELYERLRLGIEEELRPELTTHLKGVFSQYINETLKTELHELLKSELYQSLYKDIYQELFEHLYNALYVPEQVEKEYVPLM